MRMGKISQDNAVLFGCTSSVVLKDFKKKKKRRLFGGKVFTRLKESWNTVWFCCLLVWSAISPVDVGSRLRKRTMEENCTSEGFFFFGGRNKGWLLLILDLRIMIRLLKTNGQRWHVLIIFYLQATSKCFWRPQRHKNQKDYYRTVLELTGTLTQCR